MATKCAGNSEADVAERNPTMARIIAALAGARRVADIGSGAGGLSGALVKRGFEVVGIDPQEDLIAAARARVPSAEFITARAEAMPLPDASVDAAVILNALHHVPGPAMGAALRGALRILRPVGTLVVVEPLAEGSFFQAMQPIDDETVVRASALEALSRFIAYAPDNLVTHERYEIPMRFKGLAAFLDYLHEAEPARAAQVREQRATVAQAVADHAIQDGDGIILTALMAIWVFRTP